MKFKILVYFTILISLLIILNTTKDLVWAQHFESDSYIIDWGNFNITSGRKTSDNYNLTDTVGQNAPGQYDGDSVIVKSGFQYIHDMFTYFSFSIDDLSIDFGSLSPQIPSTDTNTLTITSPAGNGYQILAHQNHSLVNQVGQTIPDTTCDNSLCTESTSDTWTQSTTYGFGFTAIGLDDTTPTGIGTSQYFATTNHFRQFANYNLSETQQIIASETSPVEDRSIQVTYKVNINTYQSTGDYQNAITFTAIPNY